MELGSMGGVILCLIAITLLNLQVVCGRQLEYDDEDDSLEQNETSDDIQVVTYKLPLDFFLNKETELRKVGGNQSYSRDHIQAHSSEQPEHRNRNTTTSDETTGGVDEDNFVERVLNSNECGLSLMNDKGGLHDYIAGGYTVGYGDFPSYVRLEIEKNNGYISACGGTLITRQHVLTAAHCTRNVKQIVVRPTIYYFASDSEQRYEATTICVNEKAYNVPPHIKRVLYDASILKLDRPVTFNERIQPACLPDGPLPRNAKAIAVGLGIMDNRESADVREPEQLQALPVRQISCRSEDRHKSTVCFQSYMPQYTGDTCVGDSGGPLLMQHDGRQVVVGITSYGPLECHPGRLGYSVNANVHFLSEIIRLGLNSCR